MPTSNANKFGVGHVQSGRHQVTVSSTSKWRVGVIKGTASGESKCGKGVSFDLVSAENKVSVDVSHNRAGVAETYGEIVTQNPASVKCGRRLNWYCGKCTEDAVTAPFENKLTAEIK
ncbi:hypothetical protein PInf_005846 [Phytophthora infestans]|nr:hypothetical protein PInf_005846 [Phytophthora infestans]